MSGRPRHPQSQGLVEQAHYTLERMISAKILDDQTKSTSPPWTEWLPYLGGKVGNGRYTCTVYRARNDTLPIPVLCGYTPTVNIVV